MPSPDLTAFLAQPHVVAVVGLSPNPDRPSHEVAAFLQRRGWTVIPVNPGHGGETILGERVYASLAEIPPERGVEMVDIFRRSEAVPDIVDQALEMPKLKLIWMQLGVSHAEASAKARAAGVAVVENRCPKIEIARARL